MEWLAISTRLLSSKRCARRRGQRGAAGNGSSRKMIVFEFRMGMNEKREEEGKERRDHVRNEGVVTPASHPFTTKLQTKGTISPLTEQQQRKEPCYILNQKK